MANKFPKAIYITFEDGGSGPDYMAPNTNMMDAAEMGIKKKVGVYRLEGVQEVEGIIETRKMVRAR